MFNHIHLRCFFYCIFSMLWSNKIVLSESWKSNNNFSQCIKCGNDELEQNKSQPHFLFIQIMSLKVRIRLLQLFIRIFDEVFKTQEGKDDNVYLNLTELHIQLPLELVICYIWYVTEMFNWSLCVKHFRLKFFSKEGLGFDKYLVSS